MSQPSLVQQARDNLAAAWRALAEWEAQVPLGVYPEEEARSWVRFHRRQVALCEADLAEAEQALATR